MAAQVAVSLLEWHGTSKNTEMACCDSLRSSREVYLSDSTCLQPSDYTFCLSQIFKSVTEIEIREQQHEYN